MEKHKCLSLKLSSSQTNLPFISFRGYPLLSDFVGMDSDVIYPQGISCTMPEEHQLRLVRAIPCLEKAVIVKPGKKFSLDSIYLSLYIIYIAYKLSHHIKDRIFHRELSEIKYIISRNFCQDLILAF